MIKMEQQSYYEENMEEKPRGGFHDNMDAAKAAGSGYHDQMEGKPTPSGYPENLSLSGEAMEIMDPETGAMQIISKPQGQAGCKDKMERLQMMIKESENRFDEISAALVQIMSENIPTEENYRDHLDNMSVDLMAMKTKIDHIDFNVHNLRRTLYGPEVKKAKRERDVKEEVVTEKEAFEYMMIPKLEQDEYDDGFDATYADVDPDFETFETYDDDNDADYMSEEEEKPKTRGTRKKTKKEKGLKKAAIRTKFECDICGKKFKYGTLERHKEIVHQLETKYKCDLCNRTFKEARAYADHKEKYHNNKLRALKCQACNYSHKSIPPIRLHMFDFHEPVEIPYVIQTDTQNEVFLCIKKNCMFETQTLSDLQFHMSNQHHKSVDITNVKPKHIYGEMKCQHCDMINFSMGELKQHMKAEHPEHDGKQVMFVTEVLYPYTKHYLCQLCKFSSNNYEALQIHLQSSPNTHLKILKQAKKSGKEEEFKQENDLSGDVYSCNRCEYKTRNHVCYLDHINGELKFKKCPYCDTHFVVDSRKFRGHLMNHGATPVKGSDSWICSDCPQKFKRSGTNAYISHLYQEHKIGTPYHCKQCDFLTGSLDNMKLHETVHRDASIPCPHCSFIAQTRFRLAKHINAKHTVYECSSCDVKFTVKYEYTHHMKDHEEIGTEEKHVCDHCGSIFT